MNDLKTRSRWFRKAIVLGLIGVLGMYLLSFSASRPTNLGVTNGQLAELPNTPNGVSSQTGSPEQHMEPIKMSGSAAEEMQRIKLAIESQPRAKIVDQDSHYLHAEFTSLIFRFVDDVEFFIDDKDKVIQFRSASRVGHSDLGANRRRMNLLCEKINQ